MKRIPTLAAAILIGMTSTAFASGVPGENFILNFDLDDNGAVTMEEAYEKRDEIFFMFDYDDNGTLDSEEYDAFDEARAADHQDFGERGANGNGGNGHGRQGSGMERETNDHNGDGEVTKREFLSGTDVWFTGKDRNGDGVITHADFGPRG